MSTPATYGELMHATRRAVLSAGQQLARHPLASPDDAAAVLAARGTVIAAIREQVISMHGPARLAAHHWRPARTRAACATRIATVPITLDDATQSLTDWTDLTQQLIDATPPSPNPPPPAAAPYLSAARAIRAATDLLHTYRTTTHLAQPRPDADPAALLEPLRIAEALADTHVLYTRCRHAGMPAGDVDTALPLPAITTWAHTTRALALHLPAPVTDLSDVPTAGTIRTAQPGTEWSDRITRIAARMRALTDEHALTVTTLARVAGVGLVSHYLRQDPHGANEVNPWFAVCTQLGEWSATTPVDPLIDGDARDLLALARTAQREPGSVHAHQLRRAAHRTVDVVTGIAVIANDAMPTIDRWIPATPTPAYLRTVKAPPYLAWRPTEEPMPWPTPAAAPVNAL